MAKALYKSLRRYSLIIAFVLSLGLNSCANSKYSVQSSGGGFGQCNGSLVDADVYLQLVSGNTYSLIIVPVTVAAPGDVVSVTIANSNKSYKQLVSQVVLQTPSQQNPQQINAGYVTATDLSTYNLLAITPFDPTTDFFSSSATEATFCYLPQPGDNGTQSIPNQ